jgi:phospho-N-acetylmuramoyl-pentapeptide-transferase
MNAFGNTNVYVGFTRAAAVAILVTFLVTFASLKYFKNILPRDQGRAFAVNGALSEGKPRGAGLIFVTSFTLCTALFAPINIENLIYLVCVYGAMLTGYFDDAAETPWGNVKKGLLDLVISLTAAITYYYCNGSDISLFGGDSVVIHIPSALFIILAVALVWAAINVTNCTDGVDGLSASLVIVVLASLLHMSDFDGKEKVVILVMLSTLAAYLWFNCSPSKMLMGDAGSRALGVFLAIMFLKSGSPLMFIPLAIVIILDGGLGLLKLSFRRFLKMKNFMEGIRTPLHDHARKNKGWSDTQVVIRFVIIQIIVNYVCLAASSNF